MAKITKEIVEAVKKYAKKYPEMPQKEVGLLVGVSDWSVSCILNGKYDFLLDDGNGDTEKERKKTIKSDIPYDTYKKLVTCELAIDELINNAIKSNSGEEMLFLSAKYVDSVLKRYFPEKYEAKMKELFKEGV